MRTVFDVCLCHNSADKRVIRAVNEVLRQQHDLTTFVDESTIIGGDDWSVIVQNALALSSSCAVFVGVNGWGRYQLDGEVRPALARRRVDPSLREQVGTWVDEGLTPEERAAYLLDA